MRRSICGFTPATDEEEVYLLAEQDLTETCVLPNMPTLPTESQDLSHDVRRYLEYHLGRFMGCDRFYLYESLTYTAS